MILNDLDSWTRISRSRYGKELPASDAPSAV